MRQSLINNNFHKVNCIGEIYELEVENDFIKYFNVHFEDSRIIVSVDCYGKEFKLKEVRDLNEVIVILFSLTGIVMNQD